MLNNRQMFCSFEKVICVMRWCFIFVMIFSLDLELYQNLPLFESICAVLVCLGVWNTVLYLFVEKIEWAYKYKNILGLVESIVDLIVITVMVKVFGTYSDNFVYVFHILLSVVAYIRYRHTWWCGIAQLLIITHMCMINNYIYRHDFLLKNAGVQLALILIFGIGGLFYFITQEYTRLQMLVEVQCQDVEGLKRNISDMTRLGKMSRTILGSGSKNHILHHLIENIHKATKAEGVSLFLYGENGVESDAKLYHYHETKNCYELDQMPYEVIYNQKEIEQLRSRKAYRYCIMNHEPIISSTASDRTLFGQLLGQEVKPYIYLFNIVSGKTCSGIIICNVSRRLPVETCQNIERMIEHASIALAQVRQIEKARNKSIYDALTGVKSRGSIDETLPLMFKRSKEEQVGLGVLFVDIDYFKHFNDTYTHSIGDVVLKEVARTLRDCSPQDSLVGRYGGEEFLGVYYDVDEKQAIALAQRIREEVARINLEALVGVKSQITVSIGIALYPEHAISMEQLIQHADQAMYEAKKEKNKVSMYIPCQCKE